MPDIKQHGTAAVVAAMVAAGMQQAVPNEKIVEKPRNVTVAASKHAWPDLSDAERDALAARLAWASGKKVVIYCDGADCRDLQTDLDDAMEDAKIVSERASPTFPLGYGFEIFVKMDAVVGQHLADDIKAVTSGRLAPVVKVAPGQPDDIAIVIGKRPRK